MKEKTGLIMTISNKNIHDANGTENNKEDDKKKELNKRKFALVKFLYVSTSLLKQFLTS